MRRVVARTAAGAGLGAALAWGGAVAAGALAENYDVLTTGDGWDARGRLELRSSVMMIRRIEKEDQEDVLAAITSSAAGGRLRIGQWAGRAPTTPPSRTSRVAPEPRVRSSVVGRRRGVSWERSGFGGLWDPGSDRVGALWVHRAAGGAVVGARAARAWGSFREGRIQVWRNEAESGVRLRWEGAREWLVAERVGGEWWFGGDLRASAAGRWRGRFELAPNGSEWESRWRTSWESRGSGPELRIAAERAAIGIRSEVRLRLRAGRSWVAEGRWRNGDWRSLRGEVRWRGRPVDVRATFRAVGRRREIAVRAIVALGVHRGEFRWDGERGTSLRWVVVRAVRLRGDPEDRR